MFFFFTSHYFLNYWEITSVGLHHTQMFSKFASKLTGSLHPLVCACPKPCASQLVWESVFGWYTEDPSLLRPDEQIKETRVTCNEDLANPIQIPCSPFLRRVDKKLAKGRRQAHQICGPDGPIHHNISQGRIWVIPAWDNMLVCRHNRNCAVDQSV